MKLKWLFFCIILIILFGSSYILFPDDSVVSPVKKNAISEDNYLLPFDPHIAFTQRPPETFKFPIPIGGVGPSQNLYSGPNQYPFYCMTTDSKLGQPLVDNQLGFGVPVLENGKVVGYSKDCLIETRINYFVIEPDLSIRKLPSQLEAKAATLPLFRVEQGTINRFIYTIVMPISSNEVGDRLSRSQWNHKLIYQFNGGSGIGFRQGRQKAARVMKRQAQQLLDGYAVISSSGNKTSYTYNMLLAEDTARRVKKQFTSLYGQPYYTVGVGGSGGGLAQYLIAQNSQGVLDGLLPLYSYPDMITQTTYALDCDLLNNYFTFRANDLKAWQDWERRRLIEGLNAINDFPQKAGFLQPINQLMAGFLPSLPSGNSECINGYFGLSAFINNPRQGFLRGQFSEEITQSTNWSYWQDVSHLLGTDEQGNGLSAWDNVGVQYGLSALLSKQITIDEFLHLNHHIGSWKEQSDMQQEEIALPFGTKLPIWLTLWGNHNITKSESDKPASRHQGSILAMNNAYRSGQVFIGEVNIPIIDARHYLENELDMHHMSASFYSRLRIEKAKSHHKNHVIWVSHKDHDPTQQAFAMMDQWLMNNLNHPEKSTIENKPIELEDTCFNSDGSLIAKGKNVFNGTWNQKANGECLDKFPMFSTSRIEAGGTWAGDIFKCALISVEDAIRNGMYKSIDIEPYKTRLKRIFPNGVCDYSQPDIGRPENLYLN